MGVRGVRSCGVRIPSPFSVILVEQSKLDTDLLPAFLYCHDSYLGLSGKISMLEMRKVFRCADARRSGPATVASTVLVSSVTSIRCTYLKLNCDLFSSFTDQTTLCPTCFAEVSACGGKKPVRCHEPRHCAPKSNSQDRGEGHLALYSSSIV